MVRNWQLAACVCLLHIATAVKVKVVMHSEEDSRLEEEDPRTEAWEHKKRLEVTVMPFIKRHKHVEEKMVEYEEEKPTTTEKPHPQHPNDMLFPLIYRQTHINSMFKFGENWYTWSTEKRTDGSKAINYYICYEEPKRCDDVGWERTDTVPKCAFEIDSVMADDRACFYTFGVEPRTGALCDGADQMKVSEIVRACGPRLRSLWRFVRVGRRPPSVPKPADVNSLVCEDEEECYVSIEYRIHHDRITFSLHEPSRGQTFKSMLKRVAVEEEEKTTPAIEHHSHPRNHKKLARDEEPVQRNKFHIKVKKQPAEGKGVVKERNDSGYGNRRLVKNKIKVRDDVSDDISE